jgi:hypothetical protein
VEPELNFQPVMPKDGPHREGRRGLKERHARVAKATAMLRRMRVEFIQGSGLRAYDRAHQKKG